MFKLSKKKESPKIIESLLPPNNVFQSKAGRKIPVLFKNKKNLVIILIALSGLLASLLIFGTDVKDNKATLPQGIVFSIEGKEYNEQEVRDLIKYSTTVNGVGEEEASKVAFESLKKVRVAEKMNISLPQEIIDKRKAEIIGNGSQPDLNDPAQAQYSSWLDLIAKANAIEALVGTANPTGLKGHSYVYYFGQHLQYDPSRKPVGADDPLYIDKDKKFAEDRANFYHNQIKSGQLDPKTALEKTKVDLSSSDGSVKSNSYSTSFDSSSQISWEGDVYFGSIIEHIKKATSLGLSEISIGKAANMSNSETEMYYYFVYLESIAKGVSKDEFDKKLTELQAEYKGFTK